MTIKTRRTKISNDQDRFDLFGIRLKVNESKMVHVPNTKVKKIQYLETHGHKIEKNCKATTINVLIRNVLISKGASLTKNSTIPKLFKQVYGDSQHKIRYGTVIGYMPAMQYHTILFDDNHATTNTDLLRENKWERIYWKNECAGEHYIDYGPDCPKCFAFLGVGKEAWSRCHMCGLNEPGAMWSTRFSEMRDQVLYDE